MARRDGLLLLLHGGQADPRQLCLLLDLGTLSATHPRGRPPTPPTKIELIVVCA